MVGVYGHRIRQVGRYGRIKLWKFFLTLCVKQSNSLGWSSNVRGLEREETDEIVV